MFNGLPTLSVAVVGPNPNFILFCKLPFECRIIGLLLGDFQSIVADIEAHSLK